MTNQSVNVVRLYVGKVFALSSLNPGIVPESYI